MTAFFEKALIGLLLLTVVFSALAQGVVEAWSIAVFALLGVLMILLFGIAQVAQKRLQITLPPLALPVLAFLILGLAHSLAFGDRQGVLYSLSRDVEATRKAVLVLFFLVALLLIAANLFTTRRRLYGLVNFLIGYGVAMAMFSLLQFFTWNGRFYWFKPNRNGASPFGPFVSHNHFAGYMEMLIALAIAMALAEGRKLEARLFYGFSALLMSTATVASLSRGGMISLAAMVCFIAFCHLFLRLSGQMHGQSPAALPSRQATWIKGLLVAGALLIAMGIGILWIGPDRLAGRLTGNNASSQEETFFTSRGWIWQDTWTMIKANPVFGVGIGGFETAYPQYSHADGSLIVGQAHNDYLQVLADAGLGGGLLALWFLALIFREIFRGIKSRDAKLRAIALGSGAGIVAILIHSLFDFNLQLPSNALLFLLLLAILSQTAEIVRKYERGMAQPHERFALAESTGARKALAKEGL
jgi:O-antigen ligase